MFSFRRKSKQEPRQTIIKASPSLPELGSTGIPWPADLVDIAAIKDPGIYEEQPPSESGPKTSVDQHAIPFHKPFRTTVVGAGNGNEAGTISSMYMSEAPPQFEPKTPKSMTSNKAPKHSQRRPRIPATFNLMVVGAKGSGKTSLLRLLLETADISPTATQDQKVALEGFLRGSTKPTQAIQAACVEISESRFDRVLLSVVDTPGLDFQEGGELKLERQVNAIVKYVDQQYADTMAEESKVVRQSKGDQHIHLCIYMVDPASILTKGERRALSSFPTRPEVTRSECQHSDTPDAASSQEPEEPEDDDQLTMSPTELRIIRRIAAKTNILPVIARADSLTDDQLAAVKSTVRVGLSEAGIDLGVFGLAESKSEEPSTPKRKTKTKFAAPTGNGRAPDSPTESAGGETKESVPEGDAAEEEDDERAPRPVIKLRSSRHARPPSRSRSRRDLSSLAEDQDFPLSPTTDDADSIPNVRFSAQYVASVDVTTLLPFALIAPEVKSKPTVNHTEETWPSSDNAPSSPSSPSSVNGKRSLAYLKRPPGDLKGVFVRNYRWGTIDILDPKHCDFAAMRTAVLSTHLKLLKTRTKEVLYEKYRTEKLLARRATAQISEEQRQRLLEDLGL